MEASSAYLVVALLAAQCGSGLASCRPDKDPMVTNWPEDQAGVMLEMQQPTNVINVSMTGEVSQYVALEVNTTSGLAYFTTLPAMVGVRDFPTLADHNTFMGTCWMECGSNESGTFDFTAVIQDSNTAYPVFATSFSGHIAETFPVQLPLPDLVIFATDADAESQNYQLSFTLNDTSAFTLTAPVKTDSPEANYTTQLVLHTQLDYSKQSVHYLSITAKDPGGKSATADVTITVDDVDNRQPEFDAASYVTTLTDTETPGPINVSISAHDPDKGGPLKFSMTDPSEEQWLDYFAIDTVSAQLSLTQPITDQLADTPTSVTLLLQADETNGHFYSRSAVVVKLPAQQMTTTTAEPTTTVTSPSTSESTTVTSPSTSESTTVTSPSTSESTTVTSPSTSEFTTVTSPSTSEPTTVTSPPTSEPTTVTSPLTSEPTTVTSPPTSEPTTVTSPPTSKPTTSMSPSTTPAPPCVSLLFTQRQFVSQVNESFSGRAATVVVDPAAGLDHVQFYILTRGFENSFSIDKDSGDVQKLKKMEHQRVELLVQGVPSGKGPRNKTNSTDIVDWDETLVIVDIIDENDHAPVLDCSAFADDCSSIVIGYLTSPTAPLPAPLMYIPATDGDTGEYGVDGLSYSVTGDVVSRDVSGMLYLVQRPEASDNSTTLTVKDNNASPPSNSDTAHITLVAVSDDALYYVTTGQQLSDLNDVTSLLDDVKRAGSYQAVLSVDLQPFVVQNTVVELGAGTGSSDGDGRLYIYAIEASAGEFTAADKDSIKRAMSKTSGPNRLIYVETKEEQTQNGGSSSNTGLVVAVSVLGGLLAVLAVAGLVFGVRRRKHNTDPYTRQDDTSLESPGGSQTNVKYPPGPPPTPPPRTHISQKPPVAVSPPPPPFDYDNLAYQQSSSILERDTDYQSTELEALSKTSAPIMEPTVVTSPDAAPITAGLTPRPDTPPPISGPTPPTHGSLQPIAESPPAPAEPKPDYALKSVGFNERVKCVLPDAVQEVNLTTGDEADEADDDGPEQEERDDPTDGGQHAGAAVNRGTPLYPSLDDVKVPDDDGTQM